MKQYTAPAVHIRDAHLAYAGSVLFNELNLTLEAGKWTCLLGPSGVGKSTLLRLIAGLIDPQSTQTRMLGNVTIDGGKSLQSQVAYLSQTDSLLPWLSAFDNTLLGPTLRGEEVADAKRKAESLFADMGLEAAIHRLPQQLSGGMRQRVALIRTLVEDKPIILMDEPFSALDAITRFELQTLAATLLKGRTVFFITHDPLEALRLADEIYIMSGIPAKVHAPLTLTTPAPRDLTDPTVVKLQASLFRELVTAKEVSA